MTKEEIINYANKYKKNQRILTIIVSIFIIILGLVFLGIGIFLCLDEKILIKIIGVVMITAGFLDFMLGIRFIRFSYNNIKYMHNRDAATRYCKIHGIEYSKERKKDGN